MATYIYETIPQKAGEKPEQFEFVQSMKDDPLTKHPQTGKPVRRVITGGYGLIGIESRSESSHGHAHKHGGGGGGCCGGHCGCSH